MTFEDRCKSAKCRVSGVQGMVPILDLGNMPHADGLLTKEQLNKPEAKWPLELAFSSESKLVQITETVDPKILFGADYPYFSSFSDAWLKHCRDNALNLIKTRNLNRTSFVVELASNDGYLLKNFVEAGIPVQGIDPAPGPAKAAEKIGVPTICDFFTIDMARRMAKEGKRADVVIGNNVMAHVADTNGFVQGIREILKDDGTTSIEAPYVKDMIEHGEFDTIYHQHLCYFSVHSADYLFRKNGMFLNHVEWLPTHGGSLRYYAGRKENVQASVKKFLADEKELGMDKPGYYRGFATMVKNIGLTMRSILADIKRQGKSIAAYGAAAKGAIMINYIGADAKTLDFCVDRNVHKQGKYMPGMHIPILAPEELVKRQPDYCVILPWNFKDEILQQQAEYRKKGGKFIVPVPTPVIV